MFRAFDSGNIHGLNEHIAVRSVMDGRAFLYSLVRACGGSVRPSSWRQPSWRLLRRRRPTTAKPSRRCGPAPTRHRPADADAALSTFLPDGTVLGSGGGRYKAGKPCAPPSTPPSSSPTSSPTFASPQTVTVGGDTAAEEALARRLEELEIGGRFLACWSRTAEGWRIRSEMYVPTY